MFSTDLEAQDYIQKLGLIPHPEGGYYREMYRSDEIIANTALAERYSGDRSYATSIYFLLSSDDISAFHRIQSDEIWYYHEGSSVEIFVIHNNELKVITLGSNILAGEVLQAVIPRLSWFGAKVKQAGSFVLVSCMVAPGFDFMDFELAEKEVLLHQYPQFSSTISMLTHQ